MESVTRPPGSDPLQPAPEPRPRRKHFWLWLVLALLAVLGLWTIRFHQTRAQLETRSRPGGGMVVPVAAATAQLGDIPLYLDGLGSVSAYQTVTVRTRIDGELMNVSFQEGQFVHTGDVLAEIDPRPYQVQLEQAEAQMARDQATLANARLDLERYRLLAPKDAIPRQQLDTQAALVQQDEAIVKNDQAVIDNAKLQLVYCRITAPIDGQVGLRLVDPGNMVHAVDTNGLLVITQLQPIAVLFTLPEDNLNLVLSKLRAGVVLPVEALNRDKTVRIAQGRLLTTDNQIDPNTGTLRLKAEFENRDAALFPNQFVNVRLLVQTMRRQVIVPQVAVQNGTVGSFVYVIKPDNTVDVRPIRLGISEGNITAVALGLNAGEKVVTEGVENLQPGSRISVRSGAPQAQGRGENPGRGARQGRAR